MNLRSIPIYSTFAIVLLTFVMVVWRTVYTSRNPHTKTSFETHLGERLKIRDGTRAQNHYLSSSSEATTTTSTTSTGTTTNTHLYTGKGWANERTIDRTVVADTPFARCEIHKVRSEDGSSVINDWLWFDEKDAVNVAVVTAEGRFVVMRQRKYGIRGETLSPVGGMIEDGEMPFDAAVREVVEELGLGSRATLERMRRGEQSSAQTAANANATVAGHATDRIEGGRRVLRSLIAEEGSSSTSDSGSSGSGWVVTNSNGEGDGRITHPSESTDWLYMGKYRTAANRGGGYVYTYLLKNAVPVKPGGGSSEYKSTGDGERQVIVQMSDEEIMRAIGNAEFGEVKWAATMGFALMHLRTGLDFQPRD